VLAPAIAWPTMFMPTEWALTTQFAAFCGLYYADSHSTIKGWTPPWYGTYRFVLTAVVGVSIFISLVGRAKVGEGRTRLSTAELKDRLMGPPKSGGKHRNWAKEEQEEKARLKAEKKKEREAKAGSADVETSKGGKKGQAEAEPKEEVKDERKESVDAGGVDSAGKDKEKAEGSDK
jgi:hypothetical protein